MPHRNDATTVERVVAWFDEHGRDLPWREPDAHAWGVLVSEVMLQQTPVTRVLPIWREWMVRWPTPAKLAKAEQADVLRAWGRLGYPRRAKWLRESAAAIVEHHDGKVPQMEAELRALPGIGEYTAAAVVAFGFGQRAVVLDTNVRRIIGRVWGGVPLPPGHMTKAEREHAASLVPEGDAASTRWNVAAMEFGALVCTSRAPRCDDCPIADACAWFEAGKPGLEEAPRRTQAWHGTDRQVRGRIMEVLRNHTGDVQVTGRMSLADIAPGQMDRCLESLMADGLIHVASAERGTYRL